jgi:N-acetylglutamate synthase
LGNAKADLVEACHENWIKAFEWIASVVPEGLASRTGGVVIARTGLPPPDFNPVFAFSRPKSINEIVEGIERMFVRSGTPWALVTTLESTEYLKPVIRDLNLGRFEVSPGMVWDPVPESCPDPPKDLEIRQVVKPDEIHTFLSTGEAGFGTPPGSLNALREVLLAQTRNPNSTGGNYLGYTHVGPVATSLRFTTSGISGLYFVSVLPEFRRRGFGEAMTRRAAVDGRREGCTTSYLQASEMGRPLYERIGYRTIEEYELWKSQTA